MPSPHRRAAPGPGAAGAGPEQQPPFPVFVNLRAIGVPFSWWREQALRLEAAGYAGVAAWDHFVSRGVRSDPVLEAWTTLAAIGGATTRLGLMTFVANVMNRHPAVLARMAATLQEATGGRLTLGIGIGGHPAEHVAYGIPFPDVGERVARLEEAVAVLRALWAGGPVTRPSPFYPLVDAHAFPAPVPPPRIIVGGESRRGAELAARVGDGWTTPAATFAERLPPYLDALAAAGRERGHQQVLVAFDLPKGGSLATSPWVVDPAAAAAAWRAVGTDGAIVGANATADVDRLVEAAARR
ncbi:MAG: LLM class flavin-dependent oxidoreductase [Chloroflexi bacterium]|jgi:alkanesulfonate monooxygenase SsuD/methylene tetrahydromethanopterin reductase-like flavin-dependent oxidoreductase (luciferase family)|nr:LLM class flavin-dependent oxidoreductase [Chloroflexota bacterium]